jgi:gamma-glutamyl-gamma-aminobutyrate hydrolase PuuD
VSAVNVLVEEIENLICSDDFDIDDNLFSEKSTERTANSNRKRNITVNTVIPNV